MSIHKPSSLENNNVPPEVLKIATQIIEKINSVYTELPDPLKSIADKVLGGIQHLLENKNNKKNLGEIMTKILSNVSLLSSPLAWMKEVLNTK